MHLYISTIHCLSLYTEHLQWPKHWINSAFQEGRKTLKNKQKKFKRQEMEQNLVQYRPSLKAGALGISDQNLHTPVGSHISNRGRPKCSV